MSFSYTIVSHEEANQPKFALLDEGDYAFVVDEAKFSYSQSGNPMITVKLVINHNEREHYIYDYLISTEKTAWKIRKFCEAVGLTEAYEAGSFNENLCPQKRGRAYIGVEPERPRNDGSGQTYKARNSVIDYIDKNLMLQAAQQVQQQNMPETQFDDDVPF